MPKNIDGKVKELCVRQVPGHLAEYPPLTAASEATARREGVGKESVCPSVMLQVQIDGGQRQGAASEELAEIRDLKAKDRRLEEDSEILRRASTSFAGELDPRGRCTHAPGLGSSTSPSSWTCSPRRSWPGTPRAPKTPTR